MKTPRPPQIGETAADWFTSVAICQVNEKRGSNTCNMETDVGIFVGGVSATNTTTMMEDAGVLYLGKQLCRKINIPKTAILTSHHQLAPPGGTNQNEDQVGLLVELVVTNPTLVRINQACSVSHVVWEENPTKSNN
jgi:hypothetical protein